MAHLPHTIARNAHNIEHTARGILDHPLITFLARFGYVAKGVVYCIIGLLATRLALGAGGSATDQQGAVRAIYAQPFGKFLLILVAIGFIGFALWSLTQAILDTENHGADAKGALARLGYAAIGLSYLTLALGSLQLALGVSAAPAKDSNATAQDWTARLLSLPLGAALVILVGLIVCAIACILYSKAAQASFRKYLALDNLPANLRDGVIALGRLGYASLGVVFTIIGLFLIIAAFQHNPGAARGLGGALATLANNAAGRLLLIIVALGLLAYGLYSFVEARYRRIIVR